MKKCVLIRLYCSILSLVEKLLVRGPSTLQTSCFLNCVVISSLFFAAFISMRQSFDRLFGVTPWQWLADAEILLPRFSPKLMIEGLVVNNGQASFRDWDALPMILPRDDLNKELTCNKWYSVTNKLVLAARYQSRSSSNNAPAQGPH